MIILGSILVSIGYYEHKKAIESVQITPGDSPSPETTCITKKGEFSVFLGSQVATSNNFPFTILALGRDENNEPYRILTIDKTSGGIAVINLRVFNSKNELITRFERENPFWIANVRHKKPDAHSLIVYDDEDREVLNLNYLNSTSLRITGIFRRRGMQPFVVTSEQAKIGKMILRGTACIKSNKIAIFIDGPQLDIR